MTIEKPIKERLETYLKAIQSELAKRCPEDYKEKYFDILVLLERVWRDDADQKKGYQYFQDIYWELQKVIDIPDDDFAWHDATGGIGFLLNMTNSFYRNFEYDREEQAKEVYDYLLGITNNKSYVDFLGDHSNGWGGD